MKNTASGLMLSALLAQGAITGTARAAAPDAADPASFLVSHFAASQGDLSFAAAKMEQALEADPASTELHGSAFILAVLAGNPDASRLAASLPQNPIASLLLANDRAAAGDWQAAELGYAELKHESFAEALRPLLVAWAQEAQGLPDKAMDTLQPALASGHLAGIYLLHAALIADAAHRDGLAGKLYADLAHAQTSANLQFGEIFAAWQARSGNKDAARATIDSVLAANPDLAITRDGLMAALDHPKAPDALHGIASAYVAIAAALRQQNAPDVAALCTRLALRLAPASTNAHLMASELDTTRDMLAPAAAELAAIPATDPLAPVIQMRLANLDTRLGHPAQAEAMLQHLAETFPDRSEPPAQLGDVYAGEKQWKEAIDAYDRAIALLARPKAADWGLFYARGTVLERAHEWPRAQADMNRALELSPDQPFVLNFLGYSLADRNQNLPAAREMIERALAAKPNDGAIVDSLGWVMLRQGETREAMRTLEKAAELEPEDASITGHLGDAYWAAGRHLEAQEQWRRALVLKPDADEAERITKRLSAAK